MTTADLAGAVAAATDIELGRVPADALRHAGLVVADTVAVICAGARSPEVGAMVRLDIEEGTARENGTGSVPHSPDPWSSTVLTAPRVRTSAANAAFLNATAGTFLELDEGMRPTGHPAMHVVPAAIAVAERRQRPGSELLRAILAGYEASSRLFRAFRLRYPVHPHGHFGAVGAAVAVALLDDVDPLEAALIAATTPLLSVWDACFDGATARNTYTGLASQSGVRSCQLARAGVTGSRHALTAAFGEVAGEVADPHVLSAPLDYNRLGIVGNYLKRHSACALSHAALDALLQLPLPAVEEIRRVQVETVSNNMKLDRLPSPNDLSARFSLPYAVATAIALGRTDPEAFQFRPDVASLARLVDVEIAEDLQAAWPAASPTRVTVYTSSGELSQVVENPRGHHDAPFEEAELVQKFDDLVRSTEATSLWQTLTNLPSLDNCALLFTGTLD